MLVECLGGKYAASEGFSKRFIARMREEAISQRLKGSLDAVPEFLPGPFSGLFRLVAPNLENRFLPLLRWQKAAGMTQKAEENEVRIKVLFENSFKVGFNIGRPREARILPDEPDKLSVKDDPPPRTGGAGIQELLQESMGRAFAVVVPPLCSRLVEGRFGRNEDQGNGPAMGKMGDGKATFPDGLSLNRDDIVKGEDFRQDDLNPPERIGLFSLFAPKELPFALGNPPPSPRLIAKGESSRDPVVFSPLERS